MHFMNKDDISALAAIVLVIGGEGIRQIHPVVGVVSLAIGGMISVWTFRHNLRDLR